MMIRKNVCLSTKSKQPHFKTKEVSATFSSGLCIYIRKKRRKTLIVSRGAGSQPGSGLEMKTGVNAGGFSV